MGGNGGAAGVGNPTAHLEPLENPVTRARTANPARPARVQRLTHSCRSRCAPRGLNDKLAVTQQYSLATRFTRTDSVTAHAFYCSASATN